MIGIPEGHPLLGRVVADNATDPAGWMAARHDHLGAYDAKAFAKEASVERYVAAILKREAAPWNPTAKADNGHTYESAIMEFAGVTPNTRMFHHPEILWASATPDGVEVAPSGAVVLGEAKVKHHIVYGPDRSELRQVAWQQLVCEGSFTKWAWLTVHPQTNRPVGDPQVVRIPRLDDLIAELLPIATAVHDLLAVARTIEQENT